MRILPLLPPLFAFVAPLSGQTPANPMTSDVREAWTYSSSLILRAAEKTPEEYYGFKPTPEVRSFGEIVAHIIQSHDAICAAVKGEQAARPQLDRASKAELVSALKQSNADCDAVFADLSDAKAAEIVQLWGRNRTRIAAFMSLFFHDREHYGNLVTYMRLKGLVPPSSEPRK